VSIGVVKLRSTLLCLLGLVLLSVGVSRLYRWPVTGAIRYPTGDTTVTAVGSERVRCAEIAPGTIVRGDIAIRYELPLRYEIISSPETFSMGDPVSLQLNIYVSPSPIAHNIYYQEDKMMALSLASRGIDLPTNPVDLGPF
jgi:hypothetical protein